MQPANNEKQRRHRKATSAAMRKVAEQRRCRECGRGMAISRKPIMEGARQIGVVLACRYCGHTEERAFRLGSK